MGQNLLPELDFCSKETPLNESYNKSGKCCPWFWLSLHKCIKPRFPIARLICMFTHVYLPGIPPNKTVRCSTGMVWYVAPTTWQTTEYRCYIIIYCALKYRKSYSCIHVLILCTLHVKAVMMHTIPVVFWLNVPLYYSYIFILRNLF